jgi:hypothetical protein
VLKFSNVETTAGIAKAGRKVPLEVLGELRAITAVRQARVIEIH